MTYSIEGASEDIFTAQSTSEAMFFYLRFLEFFDIDVATVGEIDTSDPRRILVHTIEWPRKWQDLYTRSGGIIEDPYLQFIRHSNKSYTWREADAADPALCSRARFRSPNEAGIWQDGLVIPIDYGEGRFGFVSLASRRQDIPTAERQRILPVSLALYTLIRRKIASEGFRHPPFGLNAREISCIERLARGMSDIHSASSGAISATEVHRHIEEAKKKLSASTRAHLVALALRFGIICA